MAIISFSFIHLLALKRKKTIQMYSECNIIFVNIKTHVALSLEVFCFVDRYK